jgi:hypothetical protein
MNSTSMGTFIFRPAALALGLVVLMSAGAISRQANTKPAQTEKTKPAAAVVKIETKVKTLTKAKAETKKQQPVAVAKKAIRAQQANEDAQTNMLVAQFTPQFRHVLGAEFQIVRVVCGPTPDQSKKIARHAEKSFKSAVKKYAEAMRRPMNVDQRQAFDPHKLIQESLLQAILTQLTTEQATRYHEELARHASFRKDIAVRNLVVKLDRELVLDHDQREKLADSLALHWSDVWGQSPNAFVYDYAFMPNIPDKVVAPLLNETQKKIWRGVPKNNGFFNQFVMEQFGNDDPLEDPDLREARLAEAAEGDKNGK